MYHLFDDRSYFTYSSYCNKYLQQPLVESKYITDEYIEKRKTINYLDGEIEKKEEELRSLSRKDKIDKKNLKRN